MFHRNLQYQYSVLACLMAVALFLWAIFHIPAYIILLMMYFGIAFIFHWHGEIGIAVGVFLLLYIWLLHKYYPQWHVSELEKASVIFLLGGVLLMVYNRAPWHGVLRYWSVVQRLSKKHRIFILILVCVFVGLLFTNLAPSDIVFILFFLACLLFKISEKIPLTLAIILLALIPVLLIIKQTAWAEVIAIYCYYCMCIGAVLLIKEAVQEK